MKRDYATLDAIVVIGSMVIVSGIILGFFIVDVSPEVAPILSSLATGILGLPLAYGAYRWGNSVGRREVMHETSQPVTVVNPPDAPVPVDPQPPTTPEANS